MPPKSNEDSNPYFAQMKEKEDMEDIMKIVEEMERKRVSLSMPIRYFVGLALVEKNRPDIVDQLLQQTEDDSPSFDKLLILLFYANGKEDFALLDQILLRMVNMKVSNIKPFQAYFIFSRIKDEAFEKCFNSLRLLLIFVRTQCGHTFTQSFSHFIQTLEKREQHQKSTEIFETAVKLGVDIQR